jgi:uncharacterized protein YecA (UPF0149 family)
MNVDTGELRRILIGDEKSEAEQIAELMKHGFTPIPDELSKEANKELKDRDSVMVDMKKKSPLTAWAKRVKQGRNERCSCGSGKKYKNCCGR